MNTKTSLKTLSFLTCILFGASYSGFAESAQETNRISLEATLHAQPGDVVAIDLPDGQAQYRIDAVKLTTNARTGQPVTILKGYYLYDQAGFDGAIYRTVLVAGNNVVRGAISTDHKQYLVNGPLDSAKVIPMAARKVKTMNGLTNAAHMADVDPDRFYNQYGVEAREAYLTDLSRLPSLKLGQTFFLNLPEGPVPFVYTGRSALRNGPQITIPYFEWSATCLRCDQEADLYFYKDGYIGGTIPAQGLYPDDDRQVDSDDAGTWIFQATTDEEYDLMGDTDQ